MKENGLKEQDVFRQLHNRVRVKPELEIQLPVTANLYRCSGLEVSELSIQLGAKKYCAVPCIKFSGLCPSPGLSLESP